MCHRNIVKSLLYVYVICIYQIENWKLPHNMRFKKKFSWLGKYKDVWRKCAGYTDCSLAWQTRSTGFSLSQ